MDIDTLTALAEDTPVMQLSPDALQQTVSWSSAEDRPVSLGEFIAAWAPPEVAMPPPFSRQGAREHVRRVDELSETELLKTTMARVRESDPDTALGVVGEGDYGRDALLAAVQDRTAVGAELLQSTQDDIRYLEMLAEAGKLRVERAAGGTIRRLLARLQGLAHQPVGKSWPPRGLFRQETR